jgi:hypothetical protein
VRCWRSSGVRLVVEGTLVCGICEKHGDVWQVEVEEGGSMELAVRVYEKHCKQEHSWWRTILWWLGF